MGLIAREVEARGIPTLSMSSAYSITQAVNPPRAVYLDYPLGHTAGKPDDIEDQVSIMRDTLRAFSEIDQAGGIRHLPYIWQSDHSWKDRVMRPRPTQPEAAQSDSNTKKGHKDDRIARHPTPQYQTPTDARNADANCPTCVFLKESV